MLKKLKRSGIKKFQQLLDKGDLKGLMKVFKNQTDMDTIIKLGKMTSKDGNTAMHLAAIAAVMGDKNKTHYEALCQVLDNKTPENGLGQTPADIFERKALKNQPALAGPSSAAPPVPSRSLKPGRETNAKKAPLNPNLAAAIQVLKDAIDDPLGNYSLAITPTQEEALKNVMTYLESQGKEGLSSQNAGTIQKDPSINMIVKKAFSEISNKPAAAIEKMTDEVSLSEKELKELKSFTPRSPQPGR